MSLPDSPPSPQVVRDASTLSASAPLSQPDDLKAALDAEKARYANILNIIEDCERQLNQLSALHSPRNPTIRHLRHSLSHAVLEASQSKQATLRMQLRLVPAYRRSRLELGLDGFREARDETLRMEFAASAQIFDSIANGARFVVRQVMFLYEGTMGQGVRIGRAWSKLWEPLGADLVGEEGEGQGNRQEGNGEEEKAEEKIEEKD